MLMNSGHTCLFQKGVCTVYLGDNRKNSVTLPPSVQRKFAFIVKTKEEDNSKKVVPRKKVTLELFHNRLGQKYTRSLMARYTANVWQDIKLRMNPDPFCTSCKIYSMTKNYRSNNTLKTKAPFKWVYVNYCSNIPKTFDK